MQNVILNGHSYRFSRNDKGEGYWIDSNNLVQPLITQNELTQLAISSGLSEEHNFALTITRPQKTKKTKSKKVYVKRKKTAIKISLKK